MISFEGERAQLENENERESEAGRWSGVEIKQAAEHVQFRRQAEEKADGAQRESTPRPVEVKLW